MLLKKPSIDEINLALQRLPIELHNKILPLDDDCWAYLGRANSGNGYKKIKWKGKGWAVHRLIYSYCIGPIKDNFVLDHLCRNRSCCNPFHLEPVTVWENTHRGNARLFKAVKLNAD